MAELSKIEWTDHTINMWWGCTKVSPGCKNCYALTLSNRWGKDVWGKGKPREDHRAGATKLALKLNKQAQAEGRRFRIFSASMSDWLDEEVPIEWMADLLQLIYDTPYLDWLLLTKRPENWLPRMMAVLDLTTTPASPPPYSPLNRFVAEWIPGLVTSRPPSNVWIGTSVEDQARADERIPALLEIPARVRFLSCEPLLEAVSLPLTQMCPRCMPPGDPGCPYCYGTYGVPAGISWVICGGESGPGKRPFNADWARSLRDQCIDARVPFFMKQMDKVTPIPSHLMIRQFPNV